MRRLRSQTDSRPILTQAVTLLLVAAALFTFLHWHQAADQRCEICFARNLPSVYVPFTIWLGVPARVEWLNVRQEPAKVESSYFRFDSSRAPPTSL